MYYKLQSKSCNPHFFSFFYESRRLVTVNLFSVEANTTGKLPCNKVTADQIRLKHPMLGCRKVRRGKINRRKPLYDE